MSIVLVQALDLVGVPDSTNASPAEHAVIALRLSVRLVSLAEHRPSFGGVLVMHSNMLRERFGVIGQPRGKGVNIAHRFEPADYWNEGRVYQPKNVDPGHSA
jgi:hypothetical protein